MPFKIDWQTVDDVLLDMDGTLLDLHYDATFWLKNVHSIVASFTGESENEIRDRFQKELKKHEGTLAWYCTDRWAEFFGIDLIEAKKQLAHLIRYRPHAKQFLEALRPLPLRTIIVTNAHPDVIQLKLDVIPLGTLVDGIVSSHQYGVAKEHPNFGLHYSMSMRLIQIVRYLWTIRRESWTQQIAQASEKLSKLGTPIYLNHPAPHGNKVLMTSIRCYLIYWLWGNNERGKAR